jgi:hypothetical protein
VLVGGPVLPGGPRAACWSVAVDDLAMSSLVVYTFPPWTTSDVMRITLSWYFER